MDWSKLKSCLRINWQKVLNEGTGRSFSMQKRRYHKAMSLEVVMCKWGWWLLFIVGQLIFYESMSLANHFHHFIEALDFFFGVS